MCARRRVSKRERSDVHPRPSQHEDTCVGRHEGGILGVPDLREAQLAARADRNCRMRPVGDKRCRCAAPEPKARWKTVADVKKLYGTADFVGDGRIVFNIGGNKYRLVVWVKFSIERSGLAERLIERHHTNAGQRARQPIALTSRVTNACSFEPAGWFLRATHRCAPNYRS